MKALIFLTVVFTLLPTLSSYFGKLYSKFEQRNIWQWKTGLIVHWFSVKQTGSSNVEPNLRIYTVTQVTVGDLHQYILSDFGVTIVFVRSGPFSNYKSQNLRLDLSTLLRNSSTQVEVRCWWWDHRLFDCIWKNKIRKSTSIFRSPTHCACPFGLPRCDVLWCVPQQIRVNSGRSLAVHG